MSNNKQENNKQYTEDDLKKKIQESLDHYRMTQPFFELRSGISYTGRYEIDLKLYIGDTEKGKTISMQIRELLKDI